MYSTFLLGFVSCVLWKYSLQAEPTLKLVNLLYRHGDRSPVNTYPKNPHTDIWNHVWPQGLGWLTAKGIKQQYSLGSFLRRRYSGFLNETFVRAELNVTSSEEDRCLMSAYANLAGLYPPSDDQLWNEDIKWQPIPVHTRPEIEDNMLNMGAPCPRYDELFSASLNSKEVKKKSMKNKDFFKFIANVTGLYPETIDTVWKVGDILFCERQDNISWPSWATESIYDKLRGLEEFSFTLMYHGKEEIRLRGGPLLKEWINQTQHSITDPSYTIKMNMYSAHDTTVAALLETLGLYNGLSPPYTTTVFMELHQNGNAAPYVKLFFRNVTSEDPNNDDKPLQLTLPGCTAECPFEKFVTLTKDMVPVDWEKECSVGGHKTDLSFNTATIIAVSVASGVILILIVVVVAMCCRRKRQLGGFGYKMTI